jgi:hypothetical protein
VTQRELASVLFAALGVFVSVSRLPEIFVGVALVVQSPAAGAQLSQPLLSIAGLIGSLVAVALGLGLAASRDRLAARLFPDATGELTVRGVHAVALSVLGCFFAIKGLSRALWVGGVDLAALTEAALGVALFFGSRGLAGLWSASRSAGRSKEPNKRAV